MSAEWTDVHTHLNFLKIPADQAMEYATQAGVTRYITIGTEPKDHQTVLDLARTHWPRVACTLGVHPHEAQLYTPEVGAWIEAHSTDRTVVAIGEIGLDYYYSHSPHDVQRDAFRAQMGIAEKLGLPVEIHTRDAEPDTIDILNEFKGRVRGILHCFTGTQELADAALNVGFNISISGVVTFKNAEALRAVVKTVPLNRLHLETDAPFLAPVPLRGRPNEPAYLVHTAEVVASLKGISLEELSRVTQANARQMFPKLGS